MAAVPLIVIVGETASGKSALGMELARRYNGEIICADSRTVYKGMDIGTAKPSLTDRNEIPHHVLDVVTPDQSFSAADFKRLAVQAIADIGSRNALPIMVGGTGLYVDSVLYDFAFRAAGDLTKRRELEKLTVSELQQALAKKGIKPPTNDKNPRHLIRALETEGQPSVAQPIRDNTLILGIKIDRETLKQRITKRIDVMKTTGLLTEIENVSKQYGWDAPALQAPAYRAFRPYFEQKITIQEAKEQFVRNDLNLAKRQRTWFKRNTNIQWISSSEQADRLVKNFLDNIS